MNNDVFAELTESIRQAGAVKRGEVKPSRRFEIAAPNVGAYAAASRRARAGSQASSA